MKKIRNLFVLILVVSIVAITANASHSSNYDTVHFTPISNTTTWMDLYGTFTINGITAAIDDEVGVFVGNDCFGAYKVDTSGWYGFLLVYGNDSVTPAKDGADPGDLLTIKIWDSSEGVEHTLSTDEYTCIPETDHPCPDPLTWTSDGDQLHVNIAVETSAIPTLTEWGLIIFITVVMGIGVVMVLLKRRMA